MDAELLTEYEDLRRRKNGVAVTLIQMDTCGACHMQIPTGVVSSVRSSKNVLVTCPSCGRILVDN
ncbi:MAG: hypothetical protein HC802_10565 [Caldilineaceae bacterium]|nr:hypothetical protein [Caldilineaceae bacterium]